MKKLLLSLMLLFSVNASAGVFNPTLYRFAQSKDVIMITYLDQVAHCAALTLTFKPEMFDDKVYIGGKNDALSILEKANLDQFPYYESIVKEYDALPNDVKTPNEVAGIDTLRAFIQLPKIDLVHTVMVSTVNDVSEEIKDRVSGEISDGTFKDYAVAAENIFNDESCSFSLGNYYEVQIMKSKPPVDFPNFEESPLMGGDSK